MICSFVWLGSVRPVLRYQRHPTHRHSGMTRVVFTLEPLDRVDTDGQTVRHTPTQLRAVASIWRGASLTELVARPVVDYVPAPFRRLKLLPSSDDSAPPH